MTKNIYVLYARAQERAGSANWKAADVIRPTAAFATRAQAKRYAKDKQLFAIVFEVPMLEDYDGSDA